MNDNIRAKADEFADKFAASIVNGTLKRPTAANSELTSTEENMQQIDALYAESITSDSWEDIETALQQAK